MNILDCSEFTGKLRQLWANYVEITKNLPANRRRAATVTTFAKRYTAIHERSSESDDEADEPAVGDQTA